ncbi:hypothetical protein, partial [Pedobacter sp. ASV12]|uniref:hypothetical protein n=1 Tax=Pedobacter sp. ASV12 TaxID=2795120 RepID=UPI001E54647F
CVALLELSIYFSIINYLDVLSQRKSEFGVVPFVVFAVIVGSKWFVVFKDARWNYYVKKFDNWSEHKNSNGSWIVFVLTSLIILNFVYSCILFSPLRGPSY